MACKWKEVCPLRILEEKGIISKKWIKEYCSSEDNWKTCKRYQMQKEGKDCPLNMMPDGSTRDIEKEL